MSDTVFESLSQSSQFEVDKVEVVFAELLENFLTLKISWV